VWSFLPDLRMCRNSGGKKVFKMQVSHLFKMGEGGSLKVFLNYSYLLNVASVCNQKCLTYYFSILLMAS
jgi:hypothetical protein